MKFKKDKCRTHTQQGRGVSNGKGCEWAGWGGTLLEGIGVGVCSDGRSSQASSEPWQQTKTTSQAAWRARTVWKVITTSHPQKNLAIDMCYITSRYCIPFLVPPAHPRNGQTGGSQGRAASIAGQAQAVTCQQRLRELGLLSLEQGQLGGT